MRQLLLEYWWIAQDALTILQILWQSYMDQYVWHRKK